MMKPLLVKCLFLLSVGAVCVSHFAETAEAMRPDEGPKCIGCTEQQVTDGQGQPVPDDLVMFGTVIQPGLPSSDLCCKVTIRAVLGGYMTSCGAVTEQCYNAKCWKSISLEAKAVPGVCGCDGLNFDIEASRGSGTWQDPAPNSYDATNMSSWTLLETFQVTAACGLGEGLMYYRIDTDEPTGIPNTNWMPANSHVPGQDPHSDDMDIEVRIKCAECEANFQY